LNIPLGFDAVAGRLMEEGVKRRLIGAAVVVALLVIFLPMLLEKETSPPVSEREMTIPPRPDFDQGYDASVMENPVEPTASRFREYEEPLREDAPLLRELPPSALIDAPATTVPEILPEPASVPIGDRPPAPKRTPIPERRTPPATKPKPKPIPEQRTPPAAKPRPTPERKMPPAAKPTSEPARAQPPAPTSPASLSSWVIQVASLREHAHAYSMVQDLRAKGFPAYLEEVRVKGKQWHRVRIGPESGRERIESMAASLRAKTPHKGLIQRYP